MRRIVLMLVAVTLAVAPSLATSPAGAVVMTTYTGELDSGDPTMLVALFSSPVCTGGFGATDVHYEVIEFLDAVGGTYTFEEDAANTTVPIAMYIMEGSFDPLDPVPTCVAATNSNPLSISYDFVDGTDYYAVIIDDTFDQEGGDWAMQVTSPDPPPTTTTTSTTSTTQPTTTTAPPAAVAPAVAQPAVAAAAQPRFTG
jgi:hypothetical protein